MLEKITEPMQVKDCEINFKFISRKLRTNNETCMGYKIILWTETSSNKL